MDNNKAFIMMLITGLVFVIYIWIFKPNFTAKPKQTNRTEETNNINTSTVTESLTPETVDAQYELIETQQEVEYDLIFKNKNIEIEFDPYDAVIKHAWVKDTFLEHKTIKQYDLVQPSFENDGALRLKLGSWKNELTLASLTGGNNLYNYQRVGDKFTFTAKFKHKETGTIYTVEKIYTFIDDEYLFKLDIKLSNSDNVSNSFDASDNAFSLGWGTVLGVESKKHKKANKRQQNFFSYFNGKSIEKITADKKNKNIYNENEYYGEIFKTGDSSWVANNGHYFAALMYPDNQNYKYFFDARDHNNRRFFSGLSRNATNSKIESTFYIYIGPKLGKILKEYDNFARDEFKLEDSKISALNERIFLYIGNGIGYILEWIYKVVKNYGLAIIILTVLIKMLLYPLTHKSMESQQRMSQMQPKIKELQERFKDKPDQLNKETMKLYKKEGINPLGGCLPLLLQMPILLAMYNLLNRMVALKGATFLWISDLSQPDAIYTFSAPIPMLNITSLNILPIVMVITQVFSSLTMPDTQSNKQAKIMMWTMPLFFFFIFYNVSSGLVLYWTIMNILNLVQQIIIKRKKTVKA